MKKCHFKIKGECVFHRKCFLCPLKIETIDGINDMKDYINIVTIRNNSNRTYIIAVLSITISFITLILRLLGKF